MGGGRKIGKMRTRSVLECVGEIDVSTHALNGTLALIASVTCIHGSAIQVPCYFRYNFPESKTCCPHYYVLSLIPTIA